MPWLQPNLLKVFRRLTAKLRRRRQPAMTQAEAEERIQQLTADIRADLDSKLSEVAEIARDLQERRIECCDQIILLRQEREKLRVLVNLGVAKVYRDAEYFVRRN